MKKAPTCIRRSDAQPLLVRKRGPLRSWDWLKFFASLFVASLELQAQSDVNSPETELQTLRPAPGFQIELFAAEPLVVKPIQMHFDARGRLWVLCTSVYPQIKPGENPNDRLVILEDTNGDGKADKSTVFASGLSVPTGFALGEHGAFVGQGTELIHLKDSDGDDHADQTRVVLSGFGTGDSHQDINSFVWSPGGELFFCQGHNIYSRIETLDGIKRLDRAGVWRFRPSNDQLDSFFHESNGPLNPWGIAFDNWGQPFLVDGCCIGIYYLLPAMAAHKPSEKYQPLWLGKKICGVDLLSGRNFTDEEQGMMVGGTFFNNSVGRWKITEDGSGFAANELAPLVESTNRSFRVVDVKVGSDGAIYLADWYNPIIGHYQYSFRHPDRDKIHGRIWRVTKKDRPAFEKPKLVGLPLEQLLELLKADENHTRNQTRRLLADLSPSQLFPRLQEWVNDLDSKDPRYEHHLLEALMVHETHDVIEAGLLVRLLHAVDPRARAYATRVLGRWNSRVEGIWGLFKTQINDSHPRVRLEAIIALSSIASVQSIETALMAVDHPTDRFIEFALRQAVQGLKRFWAPAFAEGKLKLENDEKRLEFLVKADGTSDTLKPLIRLIKSETLPQESRERLLMILGNVGGPDELMLLLDSRTYTNASGFNYGLQAKMFSELANAQRIRQVRPSGDLAALLSLPHASSQSGQGGDSLRPEEARNAEALRLAGLWKLETLRSRLEEFAGDKNQKPAIRQAAMDGLASMGGEKSREFFLQLFDPSQPEKIRFMATARFVAVDMTLAAAKAAELLTSTSGNGDPSEIFSAFLQRTGGAEALARALDPKSLSIDMAKLGLRQMRSIGRQDSALVDVLEKAVGTQKPLQELSPEELKELVADVRSRGDRKRGATIFRRPDLNCLACHTVGNEGGRTGPDLNSIGTGQPLEFIIGAVLTPNKEIKEGYMAFEITTKDGEVHQGYKIREDVGEILLRDVQLNQELRISNGNIAKQRAVGSLMPSGLANQLTRAEFCDLLRYLSELGTPSQ